MFQNTVRAVGSNNEIYNHTMEVVVLPSSGSGNKLNFGLTGPLHFPIFRSNELHPKGISSGCLMRNVGQHPFSVKGMTIKVLIIEDKPVSKNMTQQE